MHTFKQPAVGAWQGMLSQSSHCVQGMSAATRADAVATVITQPASTARQPRRAARARRRSMPQWCAT